MAKPDPRPRGRPPVEEKGTSVSTWLRPSEHDKLIKLAHKHETSISSLVRQLLTLRLDR
jgi:hypothetical protein